MTTADVDLDDPRHAQMEAAAELIKEHKFSTPPVVIARNPTNPETYANFGISKTHLEKLGAKGRIPKFMSLWYNVLGVIPPVPNIGFFEDAAKDKNATKLVDAPIILKGLERPCRFSDNGEDVYCYVLHPEFTYDTVIHQVCMARRVAAPANAVFAVFVRMLEDHKDLDDGQIKGEIISWDWVKQHDSIPNWPHGFNEDQLIWR